MVYKIINRNRGFVILPNGERLERHGSTTVDSVNQDYERLQKLGQITIHPYEFNTQLEKYLLPKPPIEGSMYIVGCVSYAYESGRWVEKEVKPPLLPVKLKDGFQLHTNEKIYERQGNQWVTLGGSYIPVHSNPLELEQMGNLADERFSKPRKTTGSNKVTFKLNPKTDEILLMIDITGVDLVELAMSIFEMTPITGKAGMLGKKKAVLSREEAEAIVMAFNEDPIIALRMDKIKGKDCNFIVYRSDSHLFIESSWLGHTSEDLKNLLDKHGIKI